MNETFNKVEKDGFGLVVILGGIVLPLVLFIHHLLTTDIRETIYEGYLFCTYWVDAFPHLALLLGLLITGIIQLIMEKIK